MQRGRAGEMLRMYMVKENTLYASYVLDNRRLASLLPLRYGVGLDVLEI